MMLSELLGLGVALFLTMGILSYVLFGNHELFRIAAAVFVGSVAGYLGAVVLRSFLIPRLWQVTGSPQWALLLPWALALLLLLRGTRLRGLSNVVLALLVGVAGATLIAGAVLGTLFPQIEATWREWAGFTLHLSWAQGLVSWVLVMMVLMAFYFGRTETWPRVMRWGIGVGQKVGKAVVVVTLGVLFARVYQVALLALIDRLAFLWDAIRTFLLGW